MLAHAKEHNFSTSVIIGSCPEQKQEAMMFVTRTVHDAPLALKLLTDTTGLEEKQEKNYGDILTLKYETECFSKAVEAVWRLQDISTHKTTMCIFCTMTISLKIKVKPIVPVRSMKAHIG
jgi:hypothetical protein